MELKRLSLTNFKNIDSAQLEFSPKINGFIGNNGMGKSNLLDAVYVLSLCKSFSGVPDRMLITRGEDFAILKADYLRRDTDEDLLMGFGAGRRKSLKRRGKEYQRLSDHIGAFPLVMTAPQDIDLIRGTGEERRRWMDMIISQGDKRYLDALIRYNRNLEQRNRLLRDGAVNPALYEAVEFPMTMAAEYIVTTRAGWIERLTGIFDRVYGHIAGSGGEHVTLTYESSLASAPQALRQQLDSARRHDEIVRHTSVGIHRDDIAMDLDGMPMRRTGSQGQCKTFTIALRLAQYEFLREATGIRPILLLDDIFDKLDASRVERIVEMVTGNGFGQIFVTDTNRTHLDEIMARTAGEYRLWSVENGAFTPRH